jgi:hypothetical protein
VSGSGLTTCDREGKYRLAHLPVAGRLTLVAVSPSGQLCAGGEVGPDLGYTLDLTLKAPGRAKGRVVGPDGAPLAKAEILLWGGRPISRSEAQTELPSTAMRLVWGMMGRAARTDARGEWATADLVGGVRYSAVLREPGPSVRRAEVRDFLAVGGQTVDAGEMKMPAPR